MALDCRICNAPLGIQHSDIESTGIERAVCEDLCNVCGAMWRAICEHPYWVKVQKKYEEDKGYWNKELNG